jgi:hypothetical protein
MTERYKYIMVSIGLWPVLPMMLIVLYNWFELRFVEFWQSLALYLICFLPAAWSFLRYLFSFRRERMPLGDKLFTAYHASLLLASLCMLLFFAFAPQGWD